MSPAACPGVLRQRGAGRAPARAGYQQVLETIARRPPLSLNWTACRTPLRILGTTLPRATPAREAWLLDHPLFTGRPGNPYLDTHGQRTDNAEAQHLLLCRGRGHRRR